VAIDTAVNPFVEHHRQSIRLQYSCFDRMRSTLSFNRCSARR
jgi:hypothetical protein